MDATGLNWHYMLPGNAGLPSSSDTLLVQFATGAQPGGPQALSPHCYAFQPTLKSGIWQLRVPQSLQSEIIASLRNDPAVTSIDALQSVSLTVNSNFVIPNDTSLGSLYGMHNTGQNSGTVDADIDAPEAWHSATSTLGVVIADIDTGVDYRHPDLYKNIWINQAEIPATRLGNLTDLDGDGRITFWDLNDPINQGASKIEDLNSNGYIDGGDLLQPLVTTNGSVGGPDSGIGGWANGSSEDADEYVDDLVGWDFVSNDNNPLDDHGHGTHTAGTIAAMGNNNLGVVGVNWQAEIMVLKFLSSAGSGTDFGASLAIDYSVAKGAAISSNSWGSSGSSSVLYTSISNAAAAGSLFVAAAGNSNVNTDVMPFYPAAYDLDNIISVAATDSRDLRASFSNYGATTVDLGAPGVSTLSTYLNGAYATLSGTSMATPHVAGAAALVWAAHQTWLYADVKDRLLDTVDPLSSLNGKTVSGGRLNLATAIDTSALDSPGSGIDIQLQQSTVDPSGSITIEYAIAGADVGPFEIGFYRSSDQLAGGDLFLDAFLIADPADRTVGQHSKTIPLGSLGGQISLPGAGAAEIDADYAIMVVADRLQQISEDDTHPLNEDNSLLLTGSYRAENGDVLIHSGIGNENIVLAANGANLDIDVNGDTSSYPLVTVSTIRVRTHGGSDTLSASTVGKIIRAWGGDGDDVLSGGLQNDTLTGGAGADEWLITGTTANDSISVSYESTTRLRAARGTETDRFEYDSADQVEVIGGDGNDSITVGATVLLPTVLRGQNGNDVLTGGGGIDLLEGGADNDTLNGKVGNDLLDGGAGNDSWTFDGTSSADYLTADWNSATNQFVIQRQPSAGALPTDSDSGMSLEKVSILAGSGADEINLAALDASEFTAASLFSLLLDGGAGNDLIIGSAGPDTIRGNTNNDMLFGAAGNDSLDGGTGDDSLDGQDGNDQLTGGGGNDVYLGGDGNDLLTLTTAQGTSTSVDGGVGTDTLVGAPTSSTWNIDGANSGNVYSLPFTQIENLTGGSSADTFRIFAGGSISGTLNGGSGANILDYSAFGAAVTVNHQAKQATGIGLYTTSIGTVIGSSLVDTLIGTNSTATWTITASNIGTLGTFRFEGFENLSGGTGADTFKFVNSSSAITGSIQGGTGTAVDRLDYSAYPTAATVNLQLNSATAVAGGFSQIESLTGSALSDTLIGRNEISTWLITADNGGSVSSFAFASVENLTGGTSDDTFKFSSAKKVLGVLDGGEGPGINTVDYTSYTTGITVNMATSSASATGGLINVANAIGGSGADSLTGDSGNNILLGNSNNDSIFGGGGLDILVGGGGNDFIEAGADRTLLIGGSGADQLTGGASDDLVIGGSTSHDSSFAAMRAIMAEWTSASSYDLRADHLKNLQPGGLNGSVFLTTSTVQNDTAVDTLFGAGGDDWFWARLPQYVQDQAASERLN